MRKVNLKGKEVLDVGCSGGWMIEEIIRQKSKNYTGIDTNKDSIKLAKKKYPNGKFLVGSAIKIPFKDNSFDVVLAFDVLEHIPVRTEKTMFAEINRVLKPKGSLLLSTPQRSFWGTILDPAWYFGHRHYTHQQLIHYTKTANFKFKSISSGGKFWESFGLINLYLMKKMLNRDLIFKNVFENNRRLEYKKSGFVTLFLIASKKEKR